MMVHGMAAVKANVRKRTDAKAILKGLHAVLVTDALSNMRVRICSHSLH